MFFQSVKRYVIFIISVFALCLTGHMQSAFAEDSVGMLVKPLPQTQSKQQMDKPNDGIRRGWVQFDKQLLAQFSPDGFPSAGSDKWQVKSYAQQFEVAFFDDAHYQFTLDKAVSTANDVVTYYGSTANSPAGNVIVIRSQGRYAVLLWDYEKNQRYEIFGDIGSQIGHVKAVNAIENQDFCATNEADSYGKALNNQLHQSLHAPAFQPRNLSGLQPDTLQTIDLLLAYDNDAQAWLDSDPYNNQVIYSMAIQARLNQVMANSQLNIRFRVVAPMTVDSTAVIARDGEGNVLIYNLSRILNLFQQNNSAVQPVLTAREQYGADLVVYLGFPMGANRGTTGIANLLTQPTGHVQRAFSVALVDRALGQTLIHEIGHNFGAAHAVEQEDGAPNSAIGDYAAGWYFASPVAGERAYHTIMAYNYTKTGGVTTLYQPADVFSSPHLNVDGQTAGDATSADNRRVLIETSPYLAAYKASQVNHQQYTVSVASSENGVLSCSPTQALYDSTITCEATPASGFELDRWLSGCPQTTGNTCQFSLVADTVVDASFRPIVALTEALDSPSAIIYTTGGDALWFGQTGTSNDGQDAAQSGHLNPGQSSWLEAAFTVVEAGDLSFAWQISSVNAHDVLRVVLDNDVSATIVYNSYYPLWGRQGGQFYANVRIPVGVGDL